MSPEQRPCRECGMYVFHTIKCKHHMGGWELVRVLDEERGEAALHYCADCHSHCGQTIAAQARVAELEAAISLAEEEGARLECQHAEEMYEACKAMMEFVDFNYPTGRPEPYPADQMRRAIKSYEARDKQDEGCKERYHRLKMAQRLCVVWGCFNRALKDKRFCCKHQYAMNG